ncbi:MAG: DNA helicase II [Gammaproteobacteria bacterium]
MDVSHLLDPLNDAQRAAVSAPPGPVLVLAGAGSGKTRVLTHRIAWLIQVEGVSPYGILAVTFTNKAAAEMRGRTERLLGTPVGGMWIGTFHGLAHRLLRTHWHEAGLPQSFQILDSEDQYRLIRRVLKSLDLDEDQWPPKQAQWFINARKDEGQRPQGMPDQGDLHVRQMLRIYQTYEEHCRRGGLVDFAELLLRAHELLKERPELLSHYRERFRHILADEFQDTNTIQYDWLRRLAGGTAQVFVVGDDDQSIYGWRGARIENIQRFTKDFPGTQLVRLEQNYRSTGTILAAANALISCNQGRMGKKLWTDGAHGEPILLYTAFNELEEARFVVDRIQQWVADGNAKREIAILYRSNAQSRVFEEALLSTGIPYRVYGGQRFFERAEIKDALAYLRLLANPDDDAGFERVVNMPARGIGERTLAAVRQGARERGVSLWQATRFVLESGTLAARAANALQAFLVLIERLRGETAGLELHERVDHAMTASGLLEHYRNDRSERNRARVENLEELVSAARHFEPGAEDAADDPLSAFLAHAALEAGEGQADAADDCVQMMTLHSAKGLEFPLVFLCGLEEGLFPHQRSVLDPARLEEERRLCYVGITRARLRLYVCHAESRRLHGSDTYSRPSRFIGELPAELVQEIRPRAAVTRPVYIPPGPRARNGGAAPAGLALGQRVRHAKFGDGVILQYEGDGGHARVQVNFERAGSKWLVLSYANLEKL